MKLYNNGGEILTYKQLIAKAIGKERWLDSKKTRELCYKTTVKYDLVMEKEGNTTRTFKLTKSQFNKLDLHDYTSNRTLEYIYKKMFASVKQFNRKVDYNIYIKSHPEMTVLDKINYLKEQGVK